ncbi:hypothetical protein TNIN_81821 [Trichonephila inaurata madagascariensis]|uniref:Uncharacterized protein n=1 Tax=Trichonephila inaurata madagascariensis TaxID=2747483 RepID=A0A8X6YEZ4_9ARAC|nr:hypothetical protein TNIN_81821 [Trichonephila inaurata madagascariensis]
MNQTLQTKTLHSNGFQTKKTVLRTTTQKISKKDARYRYLEELVQRASNQLFNKYMPNQEKKRKSGVNPAPPEIDLTMIKRRRSFYKALFVKDILYLRVVDIENPYDYKLQVVAKHGNCMDFENLQIMMYLQKTPVEMKFFEGGLFKFEYIRGALSSCSVSERKLYVTVDPTILGGAETPKLRVCCE